MGVRFCPRCGAPRLPAAMVCGTCGLGFARVDATVADARVADSTLANPATGPGLRQAPEPPGPPDPPVPVPLVRLPATGSPAATEGADGAGARRRAVNAFVRAGAVLAGIGIVLPLVGMPQPATGLAPIGSGALAAQPLAYTPLVAVAVVVAVALAMVAAWTHDRIDTAPALVTTAAAGVGVLVLAVGCAGRLGYDAAGDVLPSVSLLAAGGASVLAAALVGATIRE
jgi:hypothetical protein